MGIDCTVHVGPYFECKFEMIKTMESKRTCPNKGCVNHNATIWDKEKKFCSQCGSEIQEVEFEVEVEGVKGEPLDAFGFAEMELQQKLTLAYGDSMRDWMNKNRLHLYLSNMRGDDSNISFDPRYDEVIEEITPERIEESTMAFLEYFSDEYAKLKEKYGEGNVGVRWGAISMVW